jgi:hypothetical protein
MPPATCVAHVLCDLHPRPRAQVVIGIAPQNPKYVPVQKPTEVVLEGDWGSTPIVKHPMSKKVSVHSTETSLAATAHLQKVRRLRPSSD